MKIPITEEFENICREIVAMDHTLGEWAEIESDDMFQSDHFCGGCESLEDEVTFSYYDDQRREYWFGVTLYDIRRIADGEIAEIEIRLAE